MLSTLVRSGSGWPSLLPRRAASASRTTKGEFFWWAPARGWNPVSYLPEACCHHVQASPKI